MLKQEFTLPFPPSVNHYWRHNQGQFYVSKEGRLYRKRVYEECLIQRIKKVNGDLKLEIDIYPPDRRKRDIDNICKAVLDSLEHANVYDNDYQIAELILRRHAANDGFIKLKLSAMEQT
jgi:crossover junction endodeoxyribonuclease RusA